MKGFCDFICLLSIIIAAFFMLLFAGTANGINYVYSLAVLVLATILFCIN